jgi:hypothetical protein
MTLRQIQFYMLCLARIAFGREAASVSASRSPGMSDLSLAQRRAQVPNAPHVIAEITSYAEYTIFSERLRWLGFQEDGSEGAPL